MTRRWGTERLALALAAAFAGSAAVVVPAGSYLLSRRHLEGVLEAETDVVAREASALVTANPDLWRFEQTRLEELLQRRLRGGEPAVRRVLDEAGRVVVESSDPLPWPVLRRSVPLLDAGLEVGRVEVARSLRPAALLALLLAALLQPLALAAVLLTRRALAQAAASRRAIEERLRQAQRLEAIGRLAGGVAHDFNNLLAAVLGYARELRDELPAGAPLQEVVGELLTVANRGVQVTGSLLAFSRRQDLELAPVDTGELVRGLERLLTTTLGPGRTLRLALAPVPLPVRVDRVQLELVLVNLAANARDAMAEGGLLELATAPVELSRAEAAALGLGGPGPFVRLDVADTGAGMDAKVREKVFDPFFTTKAVGRGTGLGLALAHGVVTQHGGAIQVASAPGQGTTFTLLFPLDARPEVAAAARAADAPTPDPGGGETVLLVEDDRHVRRAMCRVLGRAGYAVVEAADGDEALRRLAERKGAVALALLDVQLPGRSGPETLEALQRLRPGLPAVFVSGDPGEAAATGRPILRKPVEPEAVLRAVRRALDGVR